MPSTFKLNPVRKIPVPQVERIGNRFIGVINLLKRGMIMVDEDPDELQDGNAKRAAVQAILMEGQSRLAKERGISFDEAGELLSRSRVEEVKPTETDGAIVPANDFHPVKEISIFDYLTVEEKTQWMSLVSDAKLTKLLVATIFMQSRFVFAFETVHRTSPGAEAIEIEPVDFPIQAGDRISIDGHEVQAASDLHPGQSVLKLISPLQYGVESQTTCHLLDFKTGKIKAGVAEWTLENTKEVFSQSMVDAIFDFYQTERSAPAKLLEASIKQSEGNATLAQSLPLSSELPHQIRSTGENSTGASNPTESTMNGSVPPTLEVAPLG